MKPNKIKYKTNMKHGIHPTGSACIAWRSRQLLILKFKNGDVIKLPGAKYHLAGVESDMALAY